MSYFPAYFHLVFRPTYSCILLWAGPIGIQNLAFGSQPESGLWWATGKLCVVANMKPVNSSPPCGRFEMPTPNYLLMAHWKAVLRRFQKVPNRGLSIALLPTVLPIGCDTYS